MRSYARHRLKQDQFTATAKETVSWAVEHQKSLTYAGIVVAVIVAVFLGYGYYTRHRAQTAQAELSAALATYQAPLRAPGQPAQPGEISFASAQERAKAAQPQFAKLAQDYASTRSAIIANYFLGLSDVDLSDTKGAESHLRLVINSNAPDLAALAKFALANLYRGANRDPEAVKLYQDLIAHPTTTVPKSMAQLELAALYATKQPQDARKLYEDIQKENPQGPAAAIAANRLGDLK